MRHGWIVAALLLLTVESGAEPPKLRKPEGEPEKQTWKKRNLIRNGNFSGKRTAWAIHGNQAGTREEAARVEAKGDHGAYVPTERDNVSNAFVTQSLNFPGKIKAATLSLDWAIYKDIEKATLTSFSITVGTAGDDGLDPAAAPVVITPENDPGDVWQRLDYVFTRADLKKLNEFIAKGQAVSFFALLTGRGMVAEIDNIALTVDCSFTRPALPGLLAYVEQADKGYSIVVSTPDGAERETVFSASGSTDCRGLDWRPDGKALCFASDHEMGYSWWNYDIYELGEDGLRRVSNGPSLPEIAAAARPTGTVKVRLKNTTKQRLSGYVYIQGGTATEPFKLGPKDSATESVEVTVADVSDLGDRTQYVCVRDGDRSAIALKGVDVQEGKTVTLGGDFLVGSTFSGSRMAHPSYTHDAKHIVYESFAARRIEIRTGALGEALPGTEACWDPAASPVDGRVLYVQMNKGICVVDSAGGKAETLVPHPDAGHHGPSWISNGSGFLFLKLSNNPLGYRGTNVWVYGFENKTSVPVTDVVNEHLSHATLSPDGAWMAFVREPEQELMDAGLGRPELWVMKVGEAHVAWQIETKGVPRHPCWTK